VGASTANGTNIAQIAALTGQVASAIPTSQNHQGEETKLRSGKNGRTGIKKLTPRAEQKGKIEAKVHVDVQKAREMVAKDKDVEIKDSMQHRAVQLRSHLGQLKMPPQQLQRKHQSHQLRQQRPWPMQNGSQPFENLSPT
jgi:hypothetical protein